MRPIMFFGIGITNSYAGPARGHVTLRASGVLRIGRVVPLLCPRISGIKMSEEGRDGGVPWPVYDVLL